MKNIAAAAATLPRSRQRLRHLESRVGGRAPVSEVYFVKRIDNSRVHREVDSKQRHTCYSLLGLGILVFLLCLLFASQHFQCLRYGYQIQELKDQRTVLEEWNRQLQLDEASLVDPQRIDAYARQKLGLGPPAPQQVIHIGPVSSAPMSDPVLARVMPALGPDGTAGLGRGEEEVRRQP